MICYPLDPKNKNSREKIMPKPKTVAADTMPTGKDAIYHEKRVGRRKKEKLPAMAMTDGLSIFDRSHPRNVINIVPEVLSYSMDRIAKEYTMMFTMDERELKKEIDPDGITNRLRISFWDEYNLAQNEERDVKLSNVVYGCCSLDYFYKSILPSNKKLAWILTPPKDYMLAMRDLLDRCVDEMMEVIEMPIKQNGVVNVALVSQKIRLLQILDQRVKGAIVQKLAITQESKSMSLNVATTQKELQNAQAARIALPPQHDLTLRIPENLTLEELEKMEKKLMYITDIVEKTPEVRDAVIVTKEQIDGVEADMAESALNHSLQNPEKTATYISSSTEKDIFKDIK